jgi:hypothetical protein
VPLGGVGLECGEWVLDLEAVAQEADDGAEVLEGDPLGAVLPQVPGLDELAPGDGVHSRGALADHRGVGRVAALVAVDPTAEAVGAQAEEPRSLGPTGSPSSTPAAGRQAGAFESLHATVDPENEGFEAAAVDAAAMARLMSFPLSVLPDPWDRMMVATALQQGVPLVTKDRAIGGSIFHRVPARQGRQGGGPERIRRSSCLASGRVRARPRSVRLTRDA